MSIQDMEDLKQHYLDKMQSISNQIQIKYYLNERIDIHYRRECEIKIDELTGKFNGMSIKINKKKELQQLEKAANLKIISQLPSSIVITTSPPVLPTTAPDDTLSMGDEHLSTIPEKESDKFIKSSVKDLVPIPSESKDTSKSVSNCDLPSCDDFSPILEGKFVTFSNPLFDSNDDFTSSDDESLSNEDVLEDNDIESKDSYVSNLDEPTLLVTPLFDANEDECFDLRDDIDEIDAFLDMDISTKIKNDYHDSKGDIIYIESLLIDDIIPNLPPKVFLDHDLRSLKDEPEIDDLKSMVNSKGGAARYSVQAVNKWDGNYQDLAQDVHAGIDIVGVYYKNLNSEVPSYCLYQGSGKQRGIQGDGRDAYVESLLLNTCIKFLSIVELSDTIRYRRVPGQPLESLSVSFAISQIDKRYILDTLVSTCELQDVPVHDILIKEVFEHGEEQH
ncbi:hypothetical protein Tco_0893164 [Tanacetum coccineum]|uniref:Uncharacterized protein n=1 Tax=Tanacetum coccineum TaxID=301880 RepID=A0ABQ5C9N1_9ASTR